MKRPRYEIPADEWEKSVQVTCDCGWRYSTSRSPGEKAEMAEGAVEALKFHLEMDPEHQGPVLGICNRCRGRTWHSGSVGAECYWPGLYGNRCGGTFEPFEQHSVR